MQTKQEVMQEIENLRETLNERISAASSRVPDETTLKLSQRLDELLNLL